MKSDFKCDLGFLRAAEETLKAYLLSSEIYWPLNVRSPSGCGRFSKMTLGWVLLYSRRLSVFKAGQDARETLDAIENHRRQWRTAWQRKAELELPARMRLWGDFLQEYRKDNRAHARRYSYEVMRRVMIELLADAAGTLPDEQKDLRKVLDGILRGKFQAGEFIGNAEHAPAFPKKNFWFLYGSLKS